MGHCIDAHTYLIPETLNKLVPISLGAYRRHGISDRPLSESSPTLLQGLVILTALTLQSIIPLMVVTMAARIGTSQCHILSSSRSKEGTKYSRVHMKQISAGTVRDPHCGNGAFGLANA